MVSCGRSVRVSLTVFCTHRTALDSTACFFPLLPRHPVRFQFSTPCPSLSALAPPPLDLRSQAFVACTLSSFRVIYGLAVPLRPRAPLPISPLQPPTFVLLPRGSTLHSSSTSCPSALIPFFSPAGLLLCFSLRPCTAPRAIDHSLPPTASSPSRPTRVCSHSLYSSFNLLLCFPNPASPYLPASGLGLHSFLLPAHSSPVVDFHC